MLNKFKENNRYCAPKLLDIKNLERFLGFNIPEEYIEFLKSINGGEVFKEDFDLCQIDAKFATGSCPFFIAIESFFSFEILPDVWENTKDEYQKEKLFPIAEVLGGDVICINFSKEKKGEIFYHSYDFGYLKLSDSLNNFINSLITRKNI